MTDNLEENTVKEALKKIIENSDATEKDFYLSSRIARILTGITYGNGYNVLVGVKGAEWSEKLS